MERWQWERRFGRDERERGGPRQGERSGRGWEPWRYDAYRSEPGAEYGYGGEGGWNDPWSGGQYGEAVERRREPGSVRPAAKPYGVRRGPKGYQRSDERIRDDIHERLMEREHLELEDIAVEVKDGRVALAGEVPARWMKYEIEDVAAAVRGVQDIDNHLRVRRERQAPAAVSGEPVISDRESGPA